MPPVRFEIRATGDVPQGSKLEVNLARAKCESCVTKRGTPRILGRAGGEDPTAVARVMKRALEHDEARHEGKGNVVVAVTAHA